MLPKINRIKKKKDFEAIFKKGVGFKNDTLILRVLKNDLGRERFGFIVSQKVSKKAVVRNKVRRRLVEIIKSELTNFQQNKSILDLVFISLSGIEKKEFAETKESVKNILRKAKLLSKI